MIARPSPPTSMMTAGVATLCSRTKEQIAYGPALAGILLGWIGEAYVLLIDAASFFVCAFCFSRLPKQLTEVADAQAARRGETGSYLRSLLGDMRTGYRYLFGRKPVILLVFFTFLYNMAYGPVEVALPLYANQDLDGGSVALGCSGLLWPSVRCWALCSFQR